jgi:hypothetical protein
MLNATREDYEYISGSRAFSLLCVGFCSYNFCTRESWNVKELKLVVFTVVFIPLDILKLRVILLFMECCLSLFRCKVFSGINAVKFRSDVIKRFKEGKKLATRDFPRVSRKFEQFPSFSRHSSDNTKLIARSLINEYFLRSFLAAATIYLFVLTL